MTCQKTTIDWFRFRAKAEPRDVLHSLRSMFGNGRSTAKPLALVPMERGILGFRSGSHICMDDLVLGRIDFGGESQQGWVRVDIPAKGCDWVKDWGGLQAVEELPMAQIRRLDLALTTWNGEVNHEQVVSAHGAGRFITRGRPPSLQQITSSDPTAGRTCYVGKRDSDKFMRTYEKGFEMLAKSGLDSHMMPEIEGCKVEDIYRCEVELKAENVPIPFEVIEGRDQYFAGAYPFCADILPGIEADILKRRPERAPQMDMAAALENCRVQYGPTLYTALRAYGGDITAIWDKIVGDHHSQSLIEGGALLVEHE